METLEIRFNNYIKQFNLLYKLKQLNSDDKLKIEELDLKSTKNINDNLQELLVVLSPYYEYKHQFQLNNSKFKGKNYYKSDFIRKSSDVYYNSFREEIIKYSNYFNSERIRIEVSRSQYLLITPTGILKFNDNYWLFAHDFRVDITINEYFDVLVSKFFYVNYNKASIFYNSKLYKTICQKIMNENYSVSLILKIHEIIKSLNRICYKFDIDTILKFYGKRIIVDE